MSEPPDDTQANILFASQFPEAAPEEEIWFYIPIDDDNPHWLYLKADSEGHFNYAEVQTAT